MFEYITMQRRHFEELRAAGVTWIYVNHSLPGYPWIEGMDALTPHGEQLKELKRGPFDFNDYTRRGYYLAEKEPEIQAILKRQRAEFTAAIKADRTGDGFISDMFRALLAYYNTYTLNVRYVCSALGIPLKALTACPNLKNGFINAWQAAAEYQTEGPYADARPEEFY